MKIEASKTDKTIPTNLRLLLLLEELARIGTPITPTAANEVLGLPKPTIHRLFHTLEQEGFLQRDIDGRSYAPSARLRQFAGSILSTSHIRMVRQTVLQALARDVGETCAIVVPERQAMMHLDRAETDWPLRIQLAQGCKVPFHCSASGKLYLSSLNPRLFNKYIAAATLDPRTPHTITSPEALIAEIETIRTCGYGTNNQEYMEEMVAIAVPLFDQQKRLISALAIHAPIQRTDLDGLRDHLPRLKAAAAELSELVMQ